jgi:selenocysteine-specific elongation factor
MPIDRVFSIPGHGTVVTGSVTHGRLAVGESIQILPEWPDREIRVRQLQSHDRAVEHVERGQRAAVNLAGVSVEDVRRGFQLVAPGQLPASDCLTVSLTAAEQMAVGLRDHQPIRLHLATSVVLGKVRFLQVRGRGEIGTTESVAAAGVAVEKPDETRVATSAAGLDDRVATDDGTHSVETEIEAGDGELERSAPIKVLAPGQTILAQLLLDRPVLANWGQRMVVRRPSPIETLGQAVVLDPCLGRLARPDRSDLEYLQQLQSADEVERLTAAMYFSLDGRPPGANLRSRLAVPTEHWEAVVQVATQHWVTINDHTNHWVFHPRRLEKLRQMILKFLDQQHTLQPKRWFIDRTLVERHLHFVPAAVVISLLRQLQQTHKLRHSATGIGLPNRGPNLTKNQLKLLEQLLQQFRSAGLNPPTIEQCIEQTPKNKQDVVDLLKMATESGDLVAIDKQTYLASECFEAAWRVLLPHFAEGAGLTVSQIRDHLEITRKLAVPLCEYLDAVGLTVRNGDLRQLGHVEASTV